MHAFMMASRIELAGNLVGSRPRKAAGQTNQAGRKESITVHQGRCLRAFRSAASQVQRGRYQRADSQRPIRHSTSRYTGEQGFEERGGAQSPLRLIMGYGIFMGTARGRGTGAADLAWLWL